MLRTAAWRSRWVTALCLLAVGLIGCSPEHYPQTTLLPRGDFARIADSLLDTTVKWALLVFVLVEGALLYAIFRFRGKPEDPEPHQIHGNTTVEIIWTVIPGADPRRHRRAHGPRHLRDQRHPQGRTPHDRGGGASVVVGVPLSGPQPHHRQRAPHSGRPDGVAPDEDGGRRPQLLGPAVRGQARRLPQPGDPALVQGRGRRASTRASARNSAASSTPAWPSGCGRRRRRSSRPGWRTCRRWAQAARPAPSAARPDTPAPAPTCRPPARVQARQASERRFGAGRPRSRQDPAYAAGEKLFMTKGCVGCHSLQAVNAPKGMIGPNLANVGARSYIAAGTPQEHGREPRPLDPEPAGDQEGRAHAQPRRDAPSEAKPLVGPILRAHQ